MWNIVVLVLLVIVVFVVVFIDDDDDDDDDDVVVVVVAVPVSAASAVLRMHVSRATPFGSRCFNKSVILRCVSDFNSRASFCTC